MKFGIWLLVARSMIYSQGMLRKFASVVGTSKSFTICNYSYTGSRSLLDMDATLPRDMIASSARDVVASSLDGMDSLGSYSETVSCESTDVVILMYWYSSSLAAIITWLLFNNDNSINESSYYN